MANDNLDLVRRFAGADPQAEDAVLEACLAAAEEWYEAAGVPKETEGNLYNIWVANLAAWYYDNRGNADMNAAIPPYITASLHQLRAIAEKQKKIRELEAEVAEVEGSGEEP